ncbi:MAG: family 20 glycosylhydrolase, partial [Bacteroidota bacterium]
KAQNSSPQFASNLFSTYYHQKVSQFRNLLKTKDDIIFLGNSITDGGEWSEMFNDLRIKNRGISGDNTVGVLNRLDEIYQRKPAKVFLLIGINDLKNGLTCDSISKNIFRIVSILKEKSPDTQVFVQSILPLNDDFKQFPSHTSKASLIPILNEHLKTAAQQYQYIYLDFNAAFANKKNKLRAEFTNDGLHLLGKGYQHWKSLVMPYVFELNTKSSLIPKPQKLTWNDQFFFIPTTISLQSDTTLRIFEKQVKALFEPYGTIFQQNQSQKIILKLASVKSLIYADEAYELKIDSSQIQLIANTSHGIFNGLQTLRQLMRDGIYVSGCHIIDYPAFAWRGLMHDVGRNFQSLPFLKAQIEVMAQYKLNIFHFHLTENVAWRLESKLYPQLTQGEFMTRNQGEYYTQNDLKELIQFCKDRFITLVPELDMPGHSAAFKRAMGVDMQSEQGVKIVKNLLIEFCDTFDVPVLHIGGDEVKITNSNFLPEMISLIESKNKQVMGWLPGGNLSKNTIHQLWEGNTKSPKDKPSVDSRFLYINHHDPLESVITIFQHQIGNVNQGDSEHLGAITCVWADRRVANQEDILSQNPFYPALLATSERTWLGGGIKPGTTLIHEAENFTEFENRLLDHKTLYFKDKPFPYIRQANIEWQITEAFDNKGNLDAKFEPELVGEITKIKTANKSVKGGTIYIRHWWTPLSESFLGNPKENSTVYAFKRVWSDTEKETEMWIGFNNLSRSPATHTPPAGMWDDRKSKIWLNNEIIPPYNFEHAGRKGNLETPLVDEGYEYRTPTKVHLKLGWNQLLVKLPVADFKSDWQNPVKWMFTAVFLDENVKEKKGFAGKSLSKNLKLDKIFTDKMVLQREKEIPFWGKALPNSMVKIIFDNTKKEVVTNKDSVWRVVFRTQKASAKPQVAQVISEGDTLTINDILIGDVWLCAGQSNMAFMLKNEQFSHQTFPKAFNKNLRLLNFQSGLSVFNIPYKVEQMNQLQYENFYKGSWQISDSISARDFSAVGFYYGKMLQDSLNIPIGLINIAVGGSPTEAWMSAESVRDDKDISKVFEENWLKNEYLEPWCIERGHQNLDKLIKNDALIPQDSLGYNHPFKPTFLYKAGIEPLLDFPIKGVIWYQGESNSLSLERTKQHELLLPRMVKDWRKKWQLGNFPFYFCQLSSIGTEKGYKSEYWANFRDSQRQMSISIPNSGMAVTSDFGNPTDVHPTNKKVVGERLARVALAKTYYKKIVASGPKLVKLSVESNQFILTFDQVLETKNNQALIGFELEDSTGQKFVAEAKLSGYKVIIIKKPLKSFKKIQYGWQPFTKANLMNLEGLPVSTFEIKIK